MNKKPAVRSKVKAKKRPAPRKRSSSQAPSLKRSNHDEHLDTKQQEAAFQVLLNNVLCNSNDEEDFESPFQSNETTSKTAHPILVIQRRRNNFFVVDVLVSSSAHPSSRSRWSRSARRFSVAN